MVSAIGEIKKTFKTCAFGKHHASARISWCQKIKKKNINKCFVSSPLRLTNCLTAICSPSGNTCLQQLLHLSGITQVFGCHPCCLQSLLIACWWRVLTRPKPRRTIFWVAFQLWSIRNIPLFHVSCLTPIQAQIISLASLFPIVLLISRSLQCILLTKNWFPKSSETFHKFTVISQIWDLGLVKSPRRQQHGLKLPRHSWINEGTTPEKYWSWWWLWNSTWNAIVSTPRTKTEIKWRMHRHQIRYLCPYSY